MPQFVRAGLRINRWLETESREAAEFPADVITDLKTGGDMLSVFEIGASISAERIAIAVAAGKQKADETGYAVFDRAAVEAVGIGITKTKGGTPDAEVNAYHYHLKVGTAARLIELAGVIARGQIDSILSKRVEELLIAGLKSGQLDEARVNRDLLERLRPLIVG